MQRKGRWAPANEAGSGIVWALTVAGFLLILVGAVLTLSLSYHNRSLKNDDQRQAYLTARSGAEMIAKEFAKGSSTAREITAYLQENGTWTVDDVGFAAELGICSLLVRLEEQPGNGDTLTVTVTATAFKGDERQSVVATLTGIYVDNDNSDPGAAEKKLVWKIASYHDGDKEVSG